MDAKDWVPIGAAIIALVSAIVSVSFTMYSARRTTFLNTITIERIKWIDKLRTKIAEYVSAIRSFDTLSRSNENYFSSSSGQSEYRKINELNALIKLQLNAQSILDKNIIGLLDRIVLLAGNKKETQLYECEDILVKYSQVLLKMEWEKVKSEARWDDAVDDGSESAIERWIEKNPIDKVGAKVPQGVQLPPPRRQNLWLRALCLSTRDR